MNFGDLQQRVYAFLRDDLKAFVKDHEVEHWLNEAQQDLCRRTRILEKAATLTVESDNTVILPTDYIAMRGMWIADEEVMWVPRQEWHKYRSETLYPTRRIGRILFPNVHFRPKPSEGQEVQLEYAYMAVDLDGHSDTSELPAEMQDRMVHYAIAQALYKESELGEADRWFARYEANLPGAPLSKDQVEPGPQHLTYAPGPFDAVGEHRG